MLIKGAAVASATAIILSSSTKTQTRTEKKKEESNKINDGKQFASIRQLFEFRKLNQKVCLKGNLIA